MRWIGTSAVCVLLLLPAVELEAQQSDSLRSSGRPDAGVSIAGSGVSAEETPQSLLAWTPSALEAVAQRAEVRNSFVLDRNTLRAMQVFMPNSDDGVRLAIHKLDGISVHLYRFHDLGEIDAAQLEAIRQAYRERGWQHLVSGSRTTDVGYKKTDLWLTMDGMNVRGGAMMLVTPKSVSLVTFAGDLNPIDVLHLRGHFGIPAAGDDSSMKTK